MTVDELIVLEFKNSTSEELIEYMLECASKLRHMQKIIKYKKFADASEYIECMISILRSVYFRIHEELCGRKSEYMMRNNTKIGDA